MCTQPILVAPPQTYLDYLRLPSVALAARTASLPEIDTGPVVLDGAASDTRLDQDDADAAPVAYPLVQLMKAALYLDNAEGTGRELSNGHFFNDDPRRLTGLNVEIPIYEMRMTASTSGGPSLPLFTSI
ncbi:hypothetical protein GSI_04117 [Ganoderma sinense ZZ0214-1]|uniref:Uncharacterized protein n=1 Tax=Ganoderma sinense ZZ0214-1 TaxID=1077348 RepID=A0A2G8SI98_9APHY|nr:hypothetical protein GSI_04117 [Ganoderma sinense ZZ0214-1]